MPSSADDHLERALDAEPDQHVRPHAERCAGGARAGWRARSSSRVASASRSAERRRATASGVARGLRLEQLVDAALVAGTAAPVSFHSSSSRRARASPSSGSIAERRTRVGHDAPRAALSKCPSMRSIGRRVEQVGAVLERAARAVAVFARATASRSNLRGARARRRTPIEREARQLEPRARRVLQREHHLEQRRAARGRARAAAPRPASRTARPGARRRRAPSRARAAAARANVGSPDEVGAQHQGVHEEADQPRSRRGCGWRSASRRRCRPGPCSVEQRLEGGEQRHEQRRAVLAGRAPSAPARQPRREATGDGRARRSARAGRGRSVGSCERRRPGERAAPVRELLLEGLARCSQSRCQAA